MKNTQLSVFRIRKTFYESGSQDPYPDFTDPDPTHLLVTVNKNDLVKHNVTDKKFSDPEHLTTM